MHTRERTVRVCQGQMLEACNNPHWQPSGIGGCPNGRAATICSEPPKRSSHSGIAAGYARCTATSP